MTASSAAEQRPEVGHGHIPHPARRGTPGRVAPGRRPDRLPGAEGPRRPPAGPIRHGLHAGGDSGLPLSAHDIGGGLHLSIRRGARLGAPGAGHQTSQLSAWAVASLAAAEAEDGGGRPAATSSPPSSAAPCRQATTGLVRTTRCAGFASGSTPGLQGAGRTRGCPQPAHAGLPRSRSAPLRTLGAASLPARWRRTDHGARRRSVALTGGLKRISDHAAPIHAGRW